MMVVVTRGVVIRYIWHRTSSAYEKTIVQVTSMRRWNVRACISSQATRYSWDHAGFFLSMNADIPAKLVSLPGYYERDVQKSGGIQGYVSTSGPNLPIF